MRHKFLFKARSRSTMQWTSSDMQIGNIFLLRVLLVWSFILFFMSSLSILRHFTSNEQAVTKYGTMEILH